MSPTDRSRKRPRCVPRAESVENRTLMSVVPLMLNLYPQSRNASAFLRASNTSAQGEVQATPKELARERFVSKLSGTYVLGPGRFTNQSLQASVLATGGSTQSLRMNLQMSFFMPTDPSQPTTGLAAFTDKNVGSTGNTLLLDLTAEPQTGFRGLPTHFTWTVNSSSGGVWQNNTDVNIPGTNQGTLDIHYMPSKNLPRGATGAGRINLVFNGRIYTTGVTLSLSAPGDRPANP